MSWSRRELLAGLGAGAATSLLWSLGCSAPARAIRAPAPSFPDGDQVRAWLATAVAQLTAAHPGASVAGQAVVARRVVAGIDPRGRDVVRASRTVALLRVRESGGAVRERATVDVSARGIGALVVALGGGEGATGELDLGVPRRVEPDAATVAGAELDDDAWLARVDELAARADRVASSRVIHRGVRLELDDTRRWSVASGRDHEERLVRGRLGLALVAWSGTRPLIGRLERGGIGVIDGAQVGDRDLDATARGALELLTPGPLARTVSDVVLTPAITAALARAVVDTVLAAAGRPRPDARIAALRGAAVGASSISIRNDPTARAYAGYAFDDLGAPAQALSVIEGGVLVAPSAASEAAAGAWLRPGHVGIAAPAASHVEWSAGDAALDDLIAGTDRGYLVEEPTTVHLDPDAWRLTILIARARRIQRGAFTGHVYGDVALSGEVPVLLRSVVAASRATLGITERVGDLGDAVWRSTTAPWIVTRGQLERVRA